MKPPVDAAQVVPIHMGIDLGGREIGVSEHLLQRAEIGATFQQMGGEGVPEGVGRHPPRDPGAPRNPLDDTPRSHPRQGSAARVEQHASPALPPAEGGTRGVEIDRERADAFPPERAHPLLAALPEAPHQPLRQEQVVEREGAELGHPEARAVAQLEEGAVAPGERLIRPGRRQEGLPLRHGEHLGKGAPLLRRFQAVARVAREVGFSDQEPEVGVQRRDLAPDRGGCQAQVLEKVHEVAQVTWIHTSGAVHPPGLGELNEAVEVAEVVLHGMRAVARLQGEVVAEPLEKEGPLRLVAHGPASSSGSAWRAASRSSEEITGRPSTIGAGRSGWRGSKGLRAARRTRCASFRRRTIQTTRSARTTTAAMPSARLSPPKMFRIVSHSDPTAVPRRVSPPYQAPLASAMGRRARRGGRLMNPAKGATKARKAGSSRSTNMPATPNRRYSRSTDANAPGEISRRPSGLVRKRRPKWRVTA